MCVRVGVRVRVREHPKFYLTTVKTWTNASYSENAWMDSHNFHILQKHLLVSYYKYGNYLWVRLQPHILNNMYIDLIYHIIEASQNWTQAGFEPTTAMNC